MRKLLSVLLALCLVLAMVPVIASADGASITVTGLSSSTSEPSTFDDLAKALQAVNQDTGSGSVTISIPAGTYTAMANEQFKITRNNVTVTGAGQNVTTINGGTFSCSGQAGFLVSGDNVTISGVTITSTLEKQDALKVTKIADTAGLGLVKDFSLSYSSIQAKASNGLNLHGVQNAKIENITATSAGKCGISIANSPAGNGVPGVTLSDSTLSGKWGAIGLMYGTGSAYEHPVDLVLGQGNSIAESSVSKAIYSERSSEAEGTDSITFNGAVNGLEGVVGASSMKITAAEGVALPTTNFVAEVNGVSYATLQAAIDAADDGDTIKLLNNVTITSTLDITKNLVIDGNKKTLTADKCVGFYIKKDLDSFTVKNLTLKGVLEEDKTAGEGGSGSFMGIGTYNGGYGVKSLTLTDVTIDGFSYGLYFGASTSNEVPVTVDADNLTIQNCYIKGAYFEKLTDSNFTKCEFLNNGTNPEKVESNFQTWMCGVDVNLKYGTYQNIAFDGCTFSGNGANSGTALHIKARGTGDDPSYASNQAILTGVEVTGCSFANNYGTNPVVIGEPEKNNTSPKQVFIQAGVEYTNNLGSEATYKVTFTSDGSTISTMLAKGETTLPDALTKSGYTFTGWLGNGKLYKAGDKVNITADTTFTAQWSKDSSGGDITTDPEEPQEPEEPEVPDLPFTDVEEDDWYYEHVLYVYENNIMAGMSETTFEPLTTLDRAQAVQMLYNLEGKPAMTGESGFADVESGDWWSNAVVWASQNGIVAGYEDDTFRPQRKVTREEFAQMLYNYAEYKEYDLTANADLSKYPDGEKISDWAEVAMEWANGNGLINGHNNGTIDPSGTANRAQSASILANFDKNIVTD